MFALLAQATQPSGGISVFRIDLTDLVAQIIVGVLGVVALVLVQYLRAKSAESAARAKREDLTAGSILLERVKTHLYGAAAAIAEERFGKLSQKVLAKEITTKEQAHAELLAWGNDLRDAAVDYFKTQGVDLQKAIGEKALEALIKRAANEVSPFPGMETSAIIVQPKAAKAVADKGIEYTRAHATEFALDYEIKL